MSTVITVTSGKGGVGKTTTSVNLAMALALAGHRTCVIDFDIGLRNLDLVLGCERRVVYDFVNVLAGEATLRQALIVDRRVPLLSILPASQTKNKDALTVEGVGRVIGDLREDFDFIICDSPAGIESGALHAMYFADRALVVVNPEVSSVRDADRILGLLSSSTQLAEADLGDVVPELVVTRYHPRRVSQGEMLSLEDITEMLRIPLVGVIPESASVLEASNAGEPLVLRAEHPAGMAYHDLAARVTGHPRALRFVQEQAAWWQRIWRRASA